MLFDNRRRFRPGNRLSMRIIWGTRPYSQSCNIAISGTSAGGMA